MDNEIAVLGSLEGYIVTDDIVADVKRIIESSRRHAH